MIRAHLRRPAVAILLVGSSAIVGQHFVAHALGWRYEWLWAVFQYTHLTLLLAPLAAAVATWEGARWRHVGGDGRPRASRARMALRVWGACSAAVLSVYGVGIAVVGGIVRLSGVPTWPDWRCVLALVASVPVLAGWTALGTALGLAVGGGRVLPVLVGPVVLGLGILGFFLPGHLTDVGGATSSLVGLVPVAGLSASQALLWFGITAASLGAFVAPRCVGGAAAAVGLAIATGGYAWQLRLPPDRLELQPTQVHCASDVLTLCLAPGYEQFRDDAEPVRAELASRLRAAGVEQVVLTQSDPGAWGVAAGPIKRGDLVGQSGPMANRVANAFVPDSCDLIRDDSAWAAFTVIDRVLAADDFSDAGADLLRSAIDGLQGCGAS